MRRIRFLLLTAIGFVAALLTAFLSPGNWLNRVLAISLCAVMGSDSTLCAAKLAQSSNRVVAATTPAVESVVDGSWVGQRSSEFDDVPASPPASNPQAPPFPLEPGPNIIRPDFDNPASETPASISNSNGDSASVYVFYINGIQTPYDEWEKTKKIIQTNLLAPLGVQLNNLKTYNFGGTPIGDITESALQEIFQESLTQDGSALEDRIVEEIKSIDDRESEKAKQICDSRSRAKFILIGHSQGTIIANNIALKISRVFSKNPEREIQKRTKILALAPFTNFVEVKEQGFQVDYLLREDDFPANKIITFAVPRVSTIRIPSNLPCLQSDCPFILAFRRRLRQALASHYIGNYLGNPSSENYTEDAQTALEIAQVKLRNLLNFSSGEYERKQDCSETAEQPTQPQQTAQQPVAKSCAIPQEFWRSHTRQIGPVNMQEANCLIRGQVMTNEGETDGTQYCGLCSRTGNNTFGQPPKKVLCAQPEDPARRNPVPNCPANWFGGN